MLTDSDIATLRCLEEELWAVETRYDPEYMNEIFAPDFFEFGRSGRVWTREALLGKSAPETYVMRPLEGLSIREISADVAQVTYNSVVSFDGIAEHSRRSSIWSRTNTKAGWQLRFHQGTPFVLNGQ